MGRDGHLETSSPLFPNQNIRAFRAPRGYACWLRLCCCDSTAQVNLGAKRDFWTVGDIPSLREVKARTQDRNLESGAEAEAAEDAAYWLPPHGLHSLLSYICQDHGPGMAQPPVNWVFPDQLLTKKASPYTYPLDNLMEANPQAMLSLPRWLSLIQADRNYPTWPPY